jgi:zinc protease
MRLACLALVPVLALSAQRPTPGAKVEVAGKRPGGSAAPAGERRQAEADLKTAFELLKANRPFPFTIHQKTLANGLKVAVIPTGMPNLVSLQIPVSTGSRNEVEAGKSGFAHFFEHMMFRGTPTVSPDQWNATLQRTGASQNAYTSDDLTNYHTLFAKEDLETWIRLEADRFQHLRYAEPEFRTEARAVLGEYNKNSADPMQKLFETMRDNAFQVHTYKHTTMGFLKDIEDMPNQFAYSREFFARWYRPDNVTVIVAGDVDPAKIFALVEKYFGPWKRTAVKAPGVPAEPEPKQAVTVHLPWDSPTLPLLAVSFHTPAKFSTTANDSQALSFLSALLFGPRSELYQRLVVREQKVDQLFPYGGGAKDPELFNIVARVKKTEDLAYVRDAILDTCAEALALPFSPQKLDDAKTEARLSFARRLDSTNAVAGLVARLASFERDPEAVNKLLRLESTVTVEDLSRIAKATFQDRKRVVATLFHGPRPDSLKAGMEGVEPRAARLAAVPALPLLDQTAAGPLSLLRVGFAAGSIHDPAGKEGLAQLTASMLADAGTRNRSLPELMKAYSQTGSGLSALVDKERTTFVLSAPRQKAEEALELALEQLLDPGYREEDFRRLKSQQLNALKVGLKANNDEELGKLVLESRLFEGAYAHPVLGTESGLAAATLEDVKTFAKANYSRAALRAGIGGDFTPALKTKLLRALGRLPEGPAPAKVSDRERVHEGSRLFIVTKETRATAISIGIPLVDAQGARINRAHPDFAALWVATSHLGQHRDSTGVLYQRLREIRGLNYGNYAYLEAFPGGMFGFQPRPGVARATNIWQIWIRPVAPANGAFATKAALFELGKLVKNGLTEKEFQAARTFLVKFLDHLTDTAAKRLGHDLDDADLGLPAYPETFKARLKALTREDVNRAVRAHLRTDRLDLAVITKDAAAYTRDLFAEASPTPKYESPKPSLKEEDETISRLKLDLKVEDVIVAPLTEIFK